MDLRGLRIGARLAVGFGIILALLISVLVADALISSRNREAMISGLEDARMKSELAAAIKSSLLEGGIAMRNIGLQNELDAMKKEADKVGALRLQLADARAKLAKMGLGAEEKAILSDIIRLDAETDVPFKEAIRLINAFNSEDAIKLIATRIDPLNRQALAEINKLVAIQQKAAQEVLAATERAGQRLTFILFLIGAVAVAAGGVLAVLLTRSITRPLRDAVNLAKRVAAGEVSARAVVSGRDEVAELQGALRDMSASLQRIVTDVRQGTDAIVLASREIASGNGNLSSRTEMQAGALQETAGSMEQLTGAVRRNAEHAREASRLVTSASDVAVKGGTVVREVVGTMNSIKESSRRIVDIISVIDGIAFQTNILALNAAVEAARAGEQGRGFAVVAAEVRSLAQRSASAAREIKDLIGDSVDKVDAGSRLVDQAGHTMEDIVAAVMHVAGIMRDISNASDAQSSDIEEVNQAIATMDEMTQQNAALVEQAAAAAQSMEDQAAILTRAVSAFRLEDEAGGPGSARAEAWDAPVHRRLHPDDAREGPRLPAPRTHGARANQIRVAPVEIVPD